MPPLATYQVLITGLAYLLKVPTVANDKQTLSHKLQPSLQKDCEWKGGQKSQRGGVWKQSVDSVGLGWVWIQLDSDECGFSWIRMSWDSIGLGGVWNDDKLIEMIEGFLLKKIDGQVYWNPDIVSWKYLTFNYEIAGQFLLQIWAYNFP